MKLRKRKPVKVASATSTKLTKHVNPSQFRDGKVKEYLTQLGLNVREYTRMTQIKFDMLMIDKQLITI